MHLPWDNDVHADEEMAEALKDLGLLAWRGVPGCDGASISLLRDDAPSSMAASSVQGRTVDEAQYSRRERTMRQCHAGSPGGDGHRLPDRGPLA